MRALMVTALATCGLVACQDPSVDVTVDVMDVTGIEGEDLEDKVDEITVSVIDPIAAGEALGPGIAATCEDIAFNRIPRQVLDGARRTSVTAGRGVRLNGIPREGGKLFVAEARSRDGRLFGGGCAARGDITEDTSVTIPVFVAPSVQVFGRVDSVDMASVRLILTAPWDPAFKIRDHVVVTEGHAAGVSASDVMVPEEERMSDALGQYVTPVLPPPGGAAEWPAGPAQTLVRVKWSEDVLRIPSLRPWPSVAPDDGRPRIRLVEDATPGFAARWTIRAEDVVGNPDRFAAALQQPATDMEQIVVVESVRPPGQLHSFAVTAPGARDLTFFKGAVVTLLAGGWRRIAPNDQVLTAVGAGSGIGIGPALQMHTVFDCVRNPETPDDDRMLVLRMIGGVPTYIAYDAPNQPSDANDAMARMATALNAMGETLISSACLTFDDGMMNPVVQVVLSHSSTLGLSARIVGQESEVVLLPDVAGAATFTDQGGHRLAAGVAATLTGPRARSYKLASLGLVGGARVTGFIEDGRLDTEVATMPDTFDVIRVDEDNTFDLVSAFSAGQGARVQVSLGTQVNGESLSAISETLPGARGATHPMVRFLELDGRPPRELIIATDDGIDVFCLRADAPSGTRCVLE